MNANPSIEITKIKKSPLLQEAPDNEKTIIYDVLFLY